MIKTKYRCTQCGQLYAKWQGRCDYCKEWNTIEEDTMAMPSTKNNHVMKSTVKRLADVTASDSERIITNIGEFNRVMGGGIVRDSLTIITAKPGAGKSTLLLQVAQDIALKGLNVLYASGEESESQIKNRAKRILETIPDNIWIYSDMSMNQVLIEIEEIDADFIIIDSIQTFGMDEIDSSLGGPKQTMACANALLKVAKNSKKPRAIIIVGQMTKEDEMAGVRALEHLVDTVLLIEGESSEELRSVTATKNRFGATGEASFFAMTERGMIPIENPSEYFMTERETDVQVSGAALTVIKEGSRAIIVEIESLVSKSYTPYPSRISEMIRKEQLSTLTSILEQRAKIPLFDKNIVVKSTGGIQLKEHAVNLAIAMCIVSSAQNRSVPNDCVFIADIGLTGELQRVPAIETRLREADRMGYKKAYIAKRSLQRKLAFKHLQIIEKSMLYEVIIDIFPSFK